MSIISTIKRVIGIVAPIAASALGRAAAAAAKAGNPLGDAARVAAKAAEAGGAPGAVKKADVIEAITPIVIELATKGGFAAIGKDAELFAGMVVEEVVAELYPTPLLSIALAVSRFLGLK
jgi:hypothetical protein